MQRYAITALFANAPRHFDYGPPPLAWTAALLRYGNDILQGIYILCKAFTKTPFACVWGQGGAFRDNMGPSRTHE